MSVVEKTLYGERAKHDKPDKAEKPTASRLYKLVQKQEFRCALSGRELQPDNVTADHKLPINSPRGLA